MRVVMVSREQGPERMTAEIELHFEEGDGPLAGMKLVGFSLWKGADGEEYVTFPSRSFGVGQERRFFDYVRGIEPGPGETKRFKAWILDEVAALRRARG